MEIFTFLSQVIKPATDLIDSMHTSEEERLKIKEELFKVQSQLTVKVMDYESKLVQEKTKTITAEAQGQSWIQRNWRPITMLTFLVLVVCDSFGLLAFRLADQAWSLLQIGLGGYVIGRSAEKVAPHLKDAMRKD